MTSSIPAIGRVVAAVVGLLAASACDTNITGPNAMAPPANGVFVGKVYPDGETRWTFDMPSAGTVTIGFGTIDPAVRLGLAFGDLAGLECTVTDQVEVSVPSPGQISSKVAAGSKCIAVFDVGTVPRSGVSFTVTIRAS